MTIIACLKYVRYINKPLNQIDTNGYIINPYDIYMLKQLFKVKRQYGCKVIGVAMGPKQCIDIAYRVISMGLDDFYLISDKVFSGSDTYATSYIIYKAIEHIGYGDIYAFGEKTIDGETGQVPIGVSNHLQLSCITGVKQIQIESEYLYIERISMGYRKKLRVTTPCSVCFQGYTFEQPIISLLNIKKRKNPIVLSAEDINADENYCGQVGSKTQVVEATNIVSDRRNIMIEGSDCEKAQMLNSIILGKGQLL